MFVPVPLISWKQHINYQISDHVLSPPNPKMNPNFPIIKDT